MAIYTRNDLKGRINAGIKGKQDIMVDIGQTMNFAVRSVMSDIDIQSVRRQSVLSPGLFEQVFQYPAPVDLDANKLISIQEQASENPYRPYSLVTYEEFGQRRKIGTVCVANDNGINKLLISGAPDGTNQVISTLDTLTSPSGIWIGYGDAENVRADSGTKVRGSGSIRFDIDAAAGLTAGITNLALADAFNVSNFQNSNDSVLTYVYLSNIDEITNIEFRYGIDVANYYAMTASLTHFGTEFQVGWNLVRFDVDSQALTGAVDTTNCTYLALFMNKTALKVSETTFRFDGIMFANGEAQNLFYYSEYAWIDSITGAWKRNSTSDNDFLNADDEEFNLYINKAIELAGDEVDEERAAAAAGVRYMKAILKYGMDRPSESMMLTTDYQAQYYI